MKATEKATTKDTPKDSKKASKPESKKLNLKLLSLTREPLKNAGENREACALCGLCKSRATDSLFRQPSVPDMWSGKLLIITEGHEEKRAFRLLRKLWRKAGWADDDIAFVPAIRCGNKTPSMAQLRCCRPFLLKVMHTLKPKNILALGSTAMRALRNDGETNITKNRGKSLTAPGL
jgi:uracil-DNA glycosylase